MFSRKSFASRSFLGRSWALDGDAGLPPVLAREASDIVVSRGFVSVAGGALLSEAPDTLGRTALVSRQTARMLVYPGALMNR